MTLPKSIISITLLWLLWLAQGCSNGGADAKRLDRIVSSPGAVDTLAFTAPSTTNVSYLTGSRAEQFLAALSATNRIKAHPWGKGQVVAQVAGRKAGQLVFSISLYEDGA